MWKEIKFETNKYRPALTEKMFVEEENEWPHLNIAIFQGETGIRFSCQKQFSENTQWWNSDIPKELIDICVEMFKNIK